MSRIVEEIQSQIKRVKVYASVQITPRVANELMQMNTDNRPLKDRTVKAYAEQMKKGSWRFNGDVIRISKNGRLLDGQHRLAAIIMSDTNQIFNIQTGMEDAIFDVIDIGKNRNSGDVLAVMGYKNPNIMSQAVKLVMNYEAGFLKLGGNRGLEKHARFTHADMTEWVDKRDMSPMVKCVDEGSRLRNVCKFFSPGTYAGFLYIFSRKSIADAEEFFRKLTTGEDISSKKDSAIYHLRQKLINNQASRTSNMDTTHKYALLIKTWNLYREGREINRLYWSTDEAFPKAK